MALHPLGCVPDSFQGLYVIPKLGNTREVNNVSLEKFLQFDQVPALVLQLTNFNFELFDHLVSFLITTSSQESFTASKFFPRFLASFGKFS